MQHIQTGNKVNDTAQSDKGGDILTTTSTANGSITTEWQCKLCTLMNDKFSTYCEACSNPREGNNTYDDIQKLVVSLINQSASQVTLLTSVYINLCALLCHN